MSLWVMKLTGTLPGSIRLCRPPSSSGSGQDRPSSLVPCEAKPFALRVAPSRWNARVGRLLDRLIVRAGVLRGLGRRSLALGLWKEALGRSKPTSLRKNHLYMIIYVSPNNLVLGFSLRKQGAGHTGWSRP